MPEPLREAAPAKVNLTLRILGPRADGYHEIESIVGFADCCDILTLHPGNVLLLDAALTGIALPPDAQGPDNVVLKAVREMTLRFGELRSGRFHLEKHIPVAAGLGGGSSDAAAAIWMLCALNGIDPGDPRVQEAALAVGADVPVCLSGKPAIMRGIGERIETLEHLAPQAAILVNPGIPVSTAAIFDALNIAPGTRIAEPVAVIDHAPVLAAAIREGVNDLEAPAIRLCPEIGTVRDELQARGATLARMSGSGATVFGLFDSAEQADVAAKALSSDHPGWWVKPVTIG